MWAQEPRSLHLILCIIDLGRETALPACILHIWIFINQPLESATCSCSCSCTELNSACHPVGNLQEYFMQQRGLEVLLSQSQMEQKISGGLLRIADGKEVKGRRGGESPQTCLSSAVQWKRKQFTDTDTGTRTVLTPSQLCVNSIHTHSCKSSLAQLQARPSTSTAYNKLLIITACDPN